MVQKKILRIFYFLGFSCTLLFFQNCFHSGMATLSSSSMDTNGLGATPPVYIPPAYVPPSYAPPLSVGQKITTIQISNTGTSDRANVPITFGLPFRPGGLAAGASAVLRDSNGNVIPTQFELKATHRDGSIRHAIVSAVLPNLPAGRNTSLDLVVATAASQTNLDQSQIFQNGFSVLVSTTINGVPYTALLDQSSFAQAHIANWLKGPIADEELYKMSLVNKGQAHPLLNARFYVRNYNNVVRVGVAIENTQAYAANPMNVTYDLQVYVGGKLVLSQPTLKHYTHSRWYRVFYSGDTEPPVNIVMDPQYLLATRAFPHYDPNLKIDPTTVTNWMNGYNAHSGLMEIGPVTSAMEATGGRPDIGPLPSWVAIHLLSQDPQAFKVAIGTGYQAGSWPIHYREPDNDLPLNIDDYPAASLNGCSTCGDDVNPTTGRNEAFPRCAVGEDCSSPYEPDNAHQPSFAYYPYAITGDYYLLEEMVFWTSYNLFIYTPLYRKFSQGLLYDDQVRAQAWGLRSLLEAAYILPDNHAYKKYFNEKLLNNINDYTNRYVKNVNNVLGIVTDGTAIVYASNTGVAPWMQDFFTWTIGQMVNMGYPEAGDFLMFLSNFQTSRMLDPGFCWILGSAYQLVVRPTPSSPLYTNFSDIYKATFPDLAGVPCGSAAMGANPKVGAPAGAMSGYPGDTEGYPSNLQPALAVLIDSKAPRAAEAWTQFHKTTVTPDYSKEPVWDIIPY